MEQTGSEPWAVVWLRRDLRLTDQVAFSKALVWAGETGGRILPIFIFDPAILSHLQDRDDARLSFIESALRGINSSLEKINARLVVGHEAPLSFLRGLKERYPQIRSLFFNRDFEPYALERDAEVAKWAGGVGVEVHTFRDQVIFEPHEIEKDSGGPYTVYTPFARKWRAQLADDLKARTAENKVGLTRKALVSRDALAARDCRQVSLEEMGFRQSSLTMPSTLVRNETLIRYAETRNIPSLDSTTRLGVHLRFGTVSIRRLVKTAIELKADVWLSELIWREFFMHILSHFPHVVGGSFRPEYDGIRWRNAEDDYRRWEEGETGYPLVDAGMRELNQTGFMHNRVRMVAASFLVKHLLIDWRRGEAHFARRLLDFDLSANNGNWQWVAGSGCDAAPYFRVFNPAEQTKKFDPDLKYIKKWVPEYGTKAYPNPMVEHKVARQRVLDEYARALKKEG